MFDQSEKHDGTFRKDRRDFLRFGGVAIVGIATTAAAENGVRGVAEALVGRPLPLLGIGYCNPESAQPSRVIAAEHLSSGDAHFRRTPVRLGIRNFSRAEQHAGKPMSVGLNVHFGDAPFMAWHSASRGSLQLTSSPVRTLVPVDGALTLSLDALVPRSSLVSRVLKDDAPQPEETRFSLGFASGAKLRRGIYVVAFRETANEAKPDWSALRYDASAGSVLRVPSLAGSKPAPFSYVILTTDYAEKA